VCRSKIGHREAARLRQLAPQVHNNKPESEQHEGRRHSMMGLTNTAGARGVLGQVPPQDAYARTSGRVRR
jgi:hypothetical protein